MFWFCATSYFIFLTIYSREEIIYVDIVFDFQCYCWIRFPKIMLNSIFEKERTGNWTKWNSCESVGSKLIVDFFVLMFFIQRNLVTFWSCSTRVMQIPYISEYLFSIYVESVLKVFKHLNSLWIWSLGVGFWCFNISWSLILCNFRVNRHS